MHYIRTFENSGSVQKELNDETYRNVYVAYLQDSNKFDYNTLRPQYPGVSGLDGGSSSSEVTGKAVDGTIADLDLI